MLSFVNYYTRWPAMWKCKQEKNVKGRVTCCRSDESAKKVSAPHCGVNVLKKGNEAFKTKWSDQASGQKQHGGWSRNGITQFKTWASEIKTARDTEANKEIELEILQISRSENNITATTYEEQQRLNKKRPSEAVMLANTRIENLLSDSEDDVAQAGQQTCPEMEKNLP